MSNLRVYMDGDKFCAVLPTFVNLQESTAGFGSTETGAKLDLMIQLYNQLRPGGGSDSFTGNSASCGDCQSREDWSEKFSKVFVEVEREIGEGR